MHICVCLCVCVRSSFCASSLRLSVRSVSVSLCLMSMGVFVRVCVRVSVFVSHVSVRLSKSRRVYVCVFSYLGVRQSVSASMVPCASVDLCVCEMVASDLNPSTLRLFP